MKLPEIDPVVLNTIRNQTAQKQIQRSRETKVTQDKKERENQDRQEQPRHRSLEESLELLNQAMQDMDRPVRFQLTQKAGALMVQMWDIIQNRAVGEVPTERLEIMIKRLRNMLGMLMDEFI